MFSSIRFRLTFWYVVVFGLGLTMFSLYLFSTLRATIYRQFDDALLRTAQAAAGYFTEFTERGDAQKGAVETIKDIHLGSAAIAILRNGEVMAETKDPVWASLHSRLPTATTNPVFLTDAEQRQRIVGLSVMIGQATYQVVACEPLTEVYAQMDSIERSLALGLPAMILLAILGGVILSERGLGPVAAICARAEDITANNLDARLPVVHPRDEIGRFSTVINALLARLEGSFHIMRSFMMDASHELRTPLSVIQGEVDVALSRERSAAEYRESLTILRDQARRMSRIVNDLLALSRADAGQTKLQVEELYLNDLVQETVRAAQSLARRKDIRLDNHVSEEDICVIGNEELLRRMVVNLMDNAIQYTQQGGSVDVELTAVGRLATLRVVDTGVGIPAELTDRVFDRFFRVEASRNRASGGAGLGLSIVKLAAESHQGAVRLHSQPGRGSTFTVELPTA